MTQLCSISIQAVLLLSNSCTVTGKIGRSSEISQKRLTLTLLRTNTRSILIEALCNSKACSLQPLCPHRDRRESSMWNSTNANFRAVECMSVMRVFWVFRSIKGLQRVSDPIGVIGSPLKGLKNRYGGIGNSKSTSVQYIYQKLTRSMNHRKGAAFALSSLPSEPTPSTVAKHQQCSWQP